MNIDYDNFIEEFNFANTSEEKQNLLNNYLNTNSLSEEDLKEFKAQINDIKENNSIEEDIVISMEIEDGKYNLYTCLKSIDGYNMGSNYYVKVDDPKEFYKSTGIGETNSIIQNMIDAIKPIYWIVTDDGIGTLKRKNIFSNSIEFENYFIKFV